MRRLFAVAALAALAAPLHAQRTGALTAGARVRVVVDSSRGRTVGTLTGVDDAGLALRRTATDSAFFVPYDAVRTLEVSTRQRSGGEAFRRGALPGLLIGLGASFVATGLAYQADRKCNDCFFPITPVVGALGVVFTGLTTVVGGAIGLASQRDVWERVRLPGR